MDWKRLSARLLIITVPFMALSALSEPAWSLPAGAQVTAGFGSVSQNGPTLTVNQQSNLLSINWNSFGLGAGEALRFNQPGVDSIVLNRVLGQDPSSILGALSANGQVFIINPNGVLFGANAQVNVGGLVASSLQLSDQDFLAGHYRFAGDGTAGGVVNSGTLHAAAGGYVALIAPQVINAGAITASGGTAALGAGDGVTLTLADHQLLSLAVNQGTVNALAENRQLIQVDGGHVTLSAQGRDAVLSGVVNNSGVIQARTVANHNGVITLLGDADHGSVQVSGTLDASAPDGGDGGFIETSAAKVAIAPGATITTAAATGKTGQWLIDPTDYTIAASGGDITGAALASQLNASNVTIQTSSAGTGNGDILLGDAVSWTSANSLTLMANRNININAPVTNAGSGGVTLRADSQGACVTGTANCGTVLFGGGGISVNGGAVNLYYNPAGSHTATPNYSASTNYAGNVSGGTLTAYMLVNDATQLQALQTNSLGVYALGKNIDASATSTWNSGAGFTPIPFLGGSLDGSNLLGGNYEISGLTINRPITNNVGLFANLGGTIRNIGLVNSNIVGGTLYVGPLVGYDSGTITNAYATGVVSGGSNYVGGLVGFGGSITNSHAGTLVSGSTYVGGLVGYTGGRGGITNSYATGAVGGIDFVGGLAGESTGTITNSYATGAVGALSGSSYNIGGLVGDNAGIITQSYATGAVTSFGPNTSGESQFGGLAGENDKNINTSYATGAVKGGSYVGGLVGWAAFGTITNAYATGKVSAPYGYGGGLVGENDATIGNAYATGVVTGSSPLGGLVAYNYPTGTVSTSYWDTGTTGFSTSDGSANSYGMTTAQMMQSAKFSGWDFTNTWGITSGVSYPYLRALDPAGIQVVSGIVTGAVAGAPVAIASDGTLLTNSAVGNDGFYYAMLPANTFTSSNNLLAWLSGSPAADGAVVAAGTNTNVTQANINTGVLSLSLNGSVTNATLATAKGGLSDTNIPYSVSGVNLIFGNGTVNQLLLLGSNTNYQLTDGGGSIAALAALSGSLSYTQPGNLSVGTVAGLAGLTGTATANITLATTNPGASLTLNQPVSAGASIVLAAAGNFINNAGSAAINAGAGRWLVYSANPATDTFGGLLSDNTPLWSETYAGYGPGSVIQTGNRYLFSYTPTLTVSPNNASKVYGTVPSLLASVTGLVNAGNYANVFTQENYSGVPALSSPGASASAAVSGSPYTITATQGTLSAPGYAAQFNTGILDIAPAALSVTANNAGKIYDGVAFAGGAGVSYSGFVNGETAAVLGGALDYSGSSQGATNAGNYVLTPGGLTSSNYTLSFNNGRLTITPAALNEDFLAAAMLGSCSSSDTACSILPDSQKNSVAPAAKITASKWLVSITAQLQMESPGIRLPVGLSATE